MHLVPTNEICLQLVERLCSTAAGGEHDEEYQACLHQHLPAEYIAQLGDYNEKSYFLFSHVADAVCVFTPQEQLEYLKLTSICEKIRGHNPAASIEPLERIGNRYQ